MIGLLILVTIFYIIPAALTYLGFVRMYKGEFKGLKPDLLDFISIFIPLLNIGWSLYLVIDIAFNGMESLLDALHSTKSNKKFEQSNLTKKIFRL